MPRTARRPQRLTEAQLRDMLALTAHADSVELKLTVPDSERRATVAALGMDPLDAQIRQVFFFDTPDLCLNQHGVVVRARRVQGRATTPWSSCARSSPPSCPPASGRPRRWWSRSTPCPAAMSARPR